MKEIYEGYEANDVRYKFKSLSSLFVRQRYSYSESLLFAEDEKKSDLMMLERTQCDVDQLAVVGTPTSRFRLLLPTNPASVERYSWQLTMFPNKTSYHRLFKDKKCKVGSRVDGNSIFLGFVGTMQVFMIFSSRDEEPIGAGCHMSGSANSVRLPYESWLHFVTFLIWCMDKAGIPGCTVENKILRGSPTLRMAENNAPAMCVIFHILTHNFSFGVRKLASILIYGLRGCFSILFDCIVIFSPRGTLQFVDENRCSFTNFKGGLIFSFHSSPSIFTNGKPTFVAYYMKCRCYVHDFMFRNNRGS